MISARLIGQPSMTTRTAIVWMRRGFGEDQPAGGSVGQLSY
jgi:hypothetical protein